MIGSVVVPTENEQMIALRRNIVRPRAVLGATFRWILFAALAAALSSCTVQREVHEAEAHEPERAILETPSCKPGAPIIGLGPATDARPTQVIAWYMEKTWLGYAWRVPFSLPHETTIGTELAVHASDVLANCLTAKGYCVQRDPHSLLVFGSARLVGVVLLSAETNTSSSTTTGSVLYRNRAAEIKVEVQDSSSQKVLFVGNYSSFHAIDSIGIFAALFSDLDARYLEQVNEAIDDAAKKACDDPAFIAAIAPPSGAEPRPSSPAAPPP